MRRKVLLSFLCLLMGVFMLGIPAAAAANPGGGTAQPYSFTDPVPPEISVTSISTKYVGDTVTVKATSTTPCYRMSAKYVHSGTTKWLGDVKGRNYSKSFTVSSAGTYTVTVYARNYPESDSRSCSSSESVSFTVKQRVVTPTVTLNTIPNQLVGATVTVKGSATTPCYRMSAKVVHNGVTKWLGDQSGASYSKTYTVPEAGQYSVTLYARSYPESDPKSGSSNKTISFTVYNGKATPTVTISSVSHDTSSNTVTVKASSTTPCYRMAANYVIDGKTHWLGEVRSNTYSKTFTPTIAGTYTINVLARSYPESDVRSASSSKSRSLTISNSTTYTENEVTVKVFQDKAFLDMYKNNTSYMSSIMPGVNYPFKNKWNIKFTPSYYNITGMPLESCGRGYYSQCASSTSSSLNCGSHCENTSSSNNHHKNFNRNYYFAKSHYGYGGWDMALTVSSANLCHLHNGRCDTCGLGMVDSVGSDFAMVKTNTDRGDLLNVRVIQHEFSHAFGCTSDSLSECTEGQPCIMSGGFDKNESLNLPTIWCDSCAEKFNRMAH